MSEQLWTFGVELEFLLGEAMPGTKQTDARVVHSPPTELTKEEHDDEVWAQKGEITFEAEPTWNNATAHILKTLTEAGIEVERDGSGGDFDAPDLTKWQLKSDSSLEIYPDSNPLYNKYAWYQIELVSPAFWNSSSSYQEVRKVLELLNSTYLLVSNASTGLHVHVGTGTKAGPSFELLKKAGAFFYAFEPQLTTLHPENRQGGSYAQTIRDTSRFSMKRQSRPQAYGLQPQRPSKKNVLY
ncbi:hypothetical protein HYALB_00010263 [Hymenoscyphus albidus]|uniref:Amidoligase enzyme n=1 Tax=Hymenoscyphus albidus TaxID=595503 RepID=A0A9N9LV52_9HELO|nr:hypothetical protein HYALB_00010263 [Hymenoscyphus albidus]